MALVLLIDDNPQMRRTLRRVLEGANHEVIEASDGREGVELFRGRAVDVVVTDIIMPGQEGIETIMELRRFAPETKILAISGISAGDRVDFLQAARQLGADASLRKPFRAVEFLATIDNLLTGCSAVETRRLKLVARR